MHLHHHRVCLLVLLDHSRPRQLYQTSIHWRSEPGKKPNLVDGSSHAMAPWHPSGRPSFFSFFLPVTGYWDYPKRLCDLILCEHVIKSHSVVPTQQPLVLPSSKLCILRCACKLFDLPLCMAWNPNGCGRLQSLNRPYSHTVLWLCWRLETQNATFTASFQAELGENTIHKTCISWKISISWSRFERKNPMPDPPNVVWQLPHFAPAPSCLDVDVANDVGMVEDWPYPNTTLFQECSMCSCMHLFIFSLFNSSMIYFAVS